MTPVNTFKTTLPDFLAKIGRQYGKANRLWIMDRGIPTEDLLSQMRAQGANYLVATPRGRLIRLGDQHVSQPWKRVQFQPDGCQWGLPRWWQCVDTET